MVDINPVEFDPFAGPEISLIAPATEPQVEIWTSCLIGGAAANCSYNECFSLLLTGIFNTKAMMRALQEMVNMHEALRTSFSADGANICVYKELVLDIDYKDLSASTEEKRNDFVNEYNKQLVLTPFDLVTGPLFKASLFKFSESEHLLTFVAHHIVCDGWSIGIMMQDLSKLYSAFAKQEYIKMPVAPLFSDYALDQLAQSESDSNKETERYWIDQFIGSGHLLDIPTDFPRPALRTYKSSREDLVLDGALATDVKKLARSTGSSFVTTLLAAFEVFLKQVTGQEEIIVGLPSAGQPATDNYRLVGHCVNLLALRSYPKSNISFKTYLKQRRSEVLDAYEHQLFTFGSLLKKLHIARDPSRLPLVPVMFNIDMGLDDDVEFYQLHHKLISNPREYENFEIFLNIAGHEEAPTLEWSYNTQLFKPSTIKKMMDSFEFLLRELVKDPEVLIGNILSMDSGELSHQLDEWNNTACAYPKNTPLHQLISERATETPNKTAITFGKQKTNYKELNERANQLAAILIKNSVKKGDKVAFSLDRSAEMVISMLAIMKTGAIYIPLDPIFPINRINYMIEDSQAVVLLTSQTYKGKYQSNAKELILEDEWLTINDYPSADPEITVTGEDLVYILYTSGSTGMPKGVQIAQHNLVNFLYSMQKQPGLTTDDKLLAVTTISFDIAGLELFLPLLTGAEIILVDAATAKDGRALLDIIKDEQATVMQATPYTWRIMLEAGWNKTTPIKAICGGEALPAELAERILNFASSLWNVYGPTETTIWSTVKEITNANKISIGRPIDNTSIYILDNFLKPLGPGIPGEIYIGGDGVAKGYLNRPELTAEKFVNDPFTKDTGAKMYNTGDLGRFMPNGEIECLGRVDAQVKIRGYRIETGEIEYQLVNGINIKEAVVIARPDNFGIDKLVAFVVVNNNVETVNEAAQVQNWKEALRNSVPDYMVPDNFVIVSAMPLTPNGKVDKKVLAKHGISVVDAGNGYVAPRTDVEKLVADIWVEYLGIEKIGVYDNFFELGGHSLIAVQVMTRIEKETGKRLPLAALFETSTVEKLALMLEMDGKSITWDSLVPIKPKGNKMPLYMVHGAGLNVLLFNTLAMNMSPDQPVFGLQAKGLDGVEDPLESIQEIASHYINAILQQNPTGPYALAGYSFGGIIAFEMAKQFEAMGKEVKILAMFDTYAYRSPHYDPPLIKIFKRGRFFKDKMKYAFSSANGIKDTISDKQLSLKRRLKRAWWRLKYGKEQKQEGFFGYSNKIDEMNNYAEKLYQLKPYNITVEVFRAENRTFYMDDFEFLGWKPYALKGVNIHRIPGEHNTIFKAPNDKIFAQVLQKCLDDAVKK
jgi:amino acid adenylation domain-containing protein